jgi:hypothetical protein
MSRAVPLSHRPGLNSARLLLTSSRGVWVYWPHASMLESSMQRVRLIRNNTMGHLR